MIWIQKFLLSSTNIEILYVVIRANFCILPFQCFECQTGLVRVKWEYKLINYSLAPSTRVAAKHY